MQRAKDIPGLINLALWLWSPVTEEQMRSQPSTGDLHVLMIPGAVVSPNELRREGGQGKAKLEGSGVTMPGSVQKPC